MRWLLVLFLSKLCFALTLEEAIERALKDSPEIRAKRYGVSSAEFQLRAERQLFMPELFAGYRLSWQSEKQSINMPAFGPLPPMRLDSTKRTHQSVQLGLRYMLYDGGLRSSRVDIGGILLKSSQLELEESQLDLKLEVIKAYLNALSARDSLEVVRVQLRAIESDLRQREAFFREGLVAITDVLQARVRLAEVQRDLRQAEGNYRIALEELSRLTGLGEIKELQNPKVEIGELSLEELIKTALQKRPILRLAQERINLHQRERRATLSSLYPKVLLEGSYTYSDQNPNLEPKGLLSAGLLVSFNLQGAQAYYQALAKGEEEKRAREELKDLQEKVRLQVKSAYERFLVAKDNLRASEENLRFAEEFYRLSLEQYRNQIISGTDLLQAEASLTSARKARVISYYELLKAYFELLRAGGTL